MNIVIADNHALIVSALIKHFNEKHPTYNVHPCGDGAQALALIQAHAPALVISDYRMDQLNGLDLLLAIKATKLKPYFLMISMVDEGTIIRHVLDGGAHGFLNKESPMDEIFYGINQVLLGKVYICRITQEILKKQSPAISGEQYLSPRELEVLKLITAEMKNQAIAARLNINVSTVETHKKNLIRKLGVKSSIGLVKYALANRLFD